MTHLIRSKRRLSLLTILALQSFGPTNAAEWHLWEWEPSATDGHYEGVVEEDDHETYHFLNSQNSAYLGGKPLKVCDHQPSGKLVNCRMPRQVKKESERQDAASAPLDAFTSTNTKQTPAVRQEAAPLAPQTKRPTWGWLPCPPAELDVALTAGHEKEKDTQGNYKFVLSGRSEGTKLLASMTCNDYLFDLGASYWRYSTGVAFSDSTKTRQLNIKRYDLSPTVYRRLGADQLPAGINFFLGLGAEVESLPTFNLSYSKSSIFPYFAADYTTFLLTYPLAAARLTGLVGDNLLTLDARQGLLKTNIYSMFKSEERLQLAHPLTDTISALVELSSWHTGYRDQTESLENTGYGVSLGLRLTHF